MVAAAAAAAALCRSHSSQQLAGMQRCGLPLRSTLPAVLLAARRCLGLPCCLSGLICGRPCRRIGGCAACTLCTCILFLAFLMPSHSEVPLTVTPPNCVLRVCGLWQIGCTSRADRYRLHSHFHPLRLCCRPPQALLFPSVLPPSPPPLHHKFLNHYIPFLCYLRCTAPIATSASL